MERPVFNPHIKVSPEAAKSMRIKPNTVYNGGRMSTRRKNAIWPVEVANPNKVNKRRAKNKVASQSRKKNRA